MQDLTREVINISTDGSHRKKSNVVGIGGFCQYKGSNYAFSMNYTQEELCKILGVYFMEVSNPTAEYYANLFALENLRGLRDKCIIIECDFNGCASWFNEKWQRKNEGIIKIHNRIKLLQNEFLKEYNTEVSIKWVKGHAGQHGNEMADSLATSTKSINTFDKIVSMKEELNDLDLTTFKL